MPDCDCGDIEIRTGIITVNNDAGDVNIGNVQLIEYGFLCEKHPIINPVYNVVSCVKEYVNGLYIVATLDCSDYLVLGKLFLGVDSQAQVAGNPPLPLLLAGQIGPVSIDGVVYLSDKDQLGDRWGGPYVGVTFSSDAAGLVPLAQGVDYQFGETDGGFIVSELDPGGVDDNYVYITAGTATRAAAERYRFDECAIDTSMSVKYEHPMQDKCPDNNIFTIFLPDAYIAECIAITDTPGEPRLYTVRWESIWHPGSADEELGYWQFGTAV